MTIAEATETVGVADESLSAYLGVSSELLLTITGAPDMHAALPRLSRIANRMLPHDALALDLVDDNGHVVTGATVGDLPELTPRGAKMMSFRDGLIIRDLTSESLPIAGVSNSTVSLLGRGYRSLITTVTRVGDQTLGVGFWSKRRDTYEPRHLPLVRGVLDHLAVAVSRECLGRTSRTRSDRSGPARHSDARGGDPSTGASLAVRAGIVGESAEWREVLKRAGRVADTDTTVLVTGESGTGKEVVARHIHRISARSAGAFVALNCAALPEQLLESELFGYERGAFTSAQQAKPGQIELASGGVLFLDEVSEMSLAAQAKFLRVLQEREFQRLGGTKMLKANIRVIAATNRDLRKAVQRGEFREDLFYRLKVFDIAIPALRERTADILPLAEALLAEIGRSFARPPAALTPDAAETLVGYHWPGNVRELRNVLERASILCDAGTIRPEHLALEATSRAPGALATDLGTIERDTITQVLRECRWNRTRAAKRLGLTRSQLYLRLEKYGIEKREA